jgi:hypothetical protein
MCLHGETSSRVFGKQQACGEELYGHEVSLVSPAQQVVDFVNGCYWAQQTHVCFYSWASPMALPRDQEPVVAAEWFHVTWVARELLEWEPCYPSTQATDLWEPSTALPTEVPTLHHTAPVVANSDVVPRAVPLRQPAYAHWVIW